MIKIMVDSASDCRKEDFFVDYFIPIAINIDGKEYLGGVDIDSNTFYEKLQTAQEFPKTAQPAPQTFVNYFEEVKKTGDELIYFCISSALSGTYQGANLAKAMVGYDKIYIIDTNAATHLIGILVQYAAKLREKGFTADEVVEKCEELKGRVKVLAGVDTLEYLYKGGRLSRTTAAVGSVANIKPIVTVTPEGTVDSIGKCIGKMRSMQFILDKLAGFELDENFPIYSLYTYGTENCETLEQKLHEKGYQVAERLQVGSAIGTHVGPGVYAVLFVTK